ncbi:MULTISPECIES: DNA polymerase III subunit delta [Carnobacterium]|uniref:DNA polymerase III subunit delta n=1 Tax=Carnobacterium maltaromaticum TaxID=2751 RepID=A0AAW9JTY9_CARML|nr:DNA polymerase III subunit delta [Carnobacterium maltaromaticum]MDW5522428.1 DNA polymerase III subunit delta [Carnobacterium maltaromaticum]MDZ5760310.1 DNA polymerase III subunit delta [Carnobacterium maltaromaticum]TFJ75252.1 DNA polymerase III subunit delta [Carnobacterium maltaromaticum]TFJ78420.1 DNA polymerase III subunit delta [Carnobacterium maltaromaticum]CAD5901199.1 DNA polymerase clamp loader delta subunit [Carnobacterium maltaromaticum]
MNYTAEMAKITKGQFSPVYLFLGTESYLADSAKQTLIQATLAEDERDLNFGIYDMEEVPVGVALDDAESVPFFGDKRLVIMDRPNFFTAEKSKQKIDHDLVWLENYLKNPPDFTILAFFAPYEKLDERKKITKLLKKTATVIEVNTLSEKEVRHFLKDTIANEGYTMTPEAFELFIQLTDAKLSTAMSELPKLLLFSSDTKQITKSAVNDLVAKSLEQNIFALVEYVLKRQTANALSLYQDLLLQKEDPIKINAILMTQFRLLLQVKFLEKKGYQQGDSAGMLKVHPYRVKLAIQQARKFSEKVLVSAFEGLVDAEYRLKTGQGDKEMQFELFVLQFAAVK